MSVYVADADFTLHLGDVRDVLPTLAADSVDCVATSPPFFGLRDYQVDRQIGLEATPDQWADQLVRVFRECRRVLKPTGVMFVEVGDSYAAQGAGTQGETGQRANRRHTQETLGRRPPGIKPKDLIGAPWLLAFALRADGWYLRQCLIWNKPNCMPESANDRCTTAHSYVFLLSKKPRYWFDSDAIAEPNQPDGRKVTTRTVGNGSHGNYQEFGHEEGRERWPNPNGRNARSVWTIPTQGYPEAHFATWPESLAERIVKAGCPEWVCGVCGAPRVRIVERGELVGKDAGGNYVNRDIDAGVRKNGGTPGMQYENTTVGWSDCGCGEKVAGSDDAAGADGRDAENPAPRSNYRPGVILDPFMGAGTTALVARRLGRHSVGVELNESYAAMAAKRLGQQSLLAQGAA